MKRYQVLNELNWSNIVKKLNFLFIFIIILQFVTTGCGGKEERMADHFGKGKNYFANGDNEKARVEFQNVLQIDPKDIEARYMLGQVLEKIQNYRGAAGQYLAVIDADSKHVGARTHLGRLYFISRAPDKAIEIVDQALKLDPNNVEALTIRGGAKAQKGDITGAFQDANTALKLKPNNLDTIFLLSSLYVQNRKPDEAVKVLNEAIQSNPKNTSLKLTLADIYVKQNNNDAAITLLKEIIILEPENFPHKLQLASFYSKLNKLDEAEKVLRKAIQDDQKNVDAKMALIDFIDKRREKSKAIDTLETFISQYPNEYKMRFGLAGLYEEGKETDKAEGVLKKIIEEEGTEPNGLKARDRLALLYAKDQNFDEAVKLLSEVLSENKQDNDALMLRGNIALAQKDVLNAISDYRTILKDQPDSTKILLQLAKAHMLNNEPDLALDTLKKAVAISPKDIQPRMSLAILLTQLGKNDSAIDEARTILKDASKHAGALETLFKNQIVKHDLKGALGTAEDLRSYYPDKGLGYYFTGLVYQAQDHRKEAERDFELAVQKSPDSIEPLSSLIRLYITQDKTDEAVDKLNNIIRQKPKSAIAHNMLGEVYYKQKKTKQAETEFKKANEISPQLITPYKNLAMIHLSKKDNEGAIKIYQNGLKKSNGAEELVYQLASLYEQNKQ